MQVALPLFFTLLLVRGSFGAPVSWLVTLPYGIFSPIRNATIGVDIFYSIPFAAPPVGPLRLRPPQPVSVNFGTQIQSATGPSQNCGQQNAVNLTYPTQITDLFGEALQGTPVTGEEDCLYLDVYRPSSATPSSKLPVIYFIYGSGFATGGISDFDGSGIVEQSIQMDQDVIWVTGNYRLSAWGWLPGQEMQDAGLGNIGLLDQRAALEWVQQNIEAFGGDPSRVTVQGESAGAMSIPLHMTMNKGNLGGLFRAAIMESGSVYPFGPMSNGEAIFDQMVDLTGCTSAVDKIDCLRSVDSGTFYTAVQGTPNTATTYRGPFAAYTPRIDGVTITDQPNKLMSDGSFAKVPLLLGENADEGSLWVFTSLNVTSDDEFASYIQDVWPALSESTQSALLQNYPSDPSAGCPYDSGDLYQLTPQSKRIASLVGDVLFIAPRRFVSQTYTSLSLPCYTYHFSHLDSTPYLGSYHGSEVGYVLGTAPDSLDPLSLQMRASWIAFANALNPSSCGNFAGAQGMPAWPMYWQTSSGARFSIMHFGEGANNTLMSDDFRESAIRVILENMPELTV